MCEMEGFTLFTYMLASLLHSLCVFLPLVNLLLCGTEIDVRLWVKPSALGTPGPLGGFYVRCECGAVCRGGRAAADMTDNRTAASPGRVLDKSAPERDRQNRWEQFNLKHILLIGRKQECSTQVWVCLGNLLICLLLSSKEQAEGSEKQK